MQNYIVLLTTCSSKGGKTVGFSEPFHPPSTKQEMHLLHMDPAHSIKIIMDTYGDEIKRLIYTYIKNTANTDDVTQEVFVTVYQKLTFFQGNSSLRSWIYAIAINKCKDHLRSFHSRNKKLKEKLIHSIRFSETQGNMPEDLTIQQNESSLLMDQVMGLPVKYREVIILYYFKDLTTKEISEILHINEATIRTRLRRGRGKLKQLLATERGVIHG